jgi:hypothetical protein
VVVVVVVVVMVVVVVVVGGGGGGGDDGRDDDGGGGSTLARAGGVVWLCGVRRCAHTHLRPVESGSEHELHLTAVRWLDLTGHSHLRGPLERAHVHVLVLVW